MPGCPLPPLRPEVQSFLSSCENLLSAGVAPHNAPFSSDELQIVNYYAAEVAKMVGQLAKMQVSFPILHSLP
jgi:hypothetical protein